MTNRIFFKYLKYLSSYSTLIPHPASKPPLRPLNALLTTIITIIISSIQSDDSLASSYLS